MEIQESLPERRKEKRFKLKDPAFAIMYCSTTITGQIIDISRSGLAVRYNKNGDCFCKLNQLDIFKSDFSFCIDNINAKTVSDMEVIDETVSGFKEIRRCGIKFENMPNNQISQIESIIQNYT